MNVIFVKFCAKNVSRVGNQYVKKTCKYTAQKPTALSHCVILTFSPAMQIVTSGWISTHYLFSLIFRSSKIQCSLTHTRFYQQWKWCLTKSCDDDKWQNVSFAIVFCIEKIYRLNIYIIIMIKRKIRCFLFALTASLHLDDAEFKYSSSRVASWKLCFSLTVLRRKLRNRSEFFPPQHQAAQRAAAAHAARRSDDGFSPKHPELDKKCWLGTSPLENLTRKYLDCFWIEKHWRHTLHFEL